MCANFGFAALSSVYGPGPPRLIVRKLRSRRVTGILNETVAKLSGQSCAQFAGGKAVRPALS
jgi:hypothetical protein